MSSDPLPYTQVDRAVKPKAATLSTLLGIPYQHALGALVEFWDSCGDPRELEQRLARGETAVVLTHAELETRLLVAFGRPVDPDNLRILGLLERLADGYRVRGMSRYFAPIEARRQARKAASAGGLATAAAAKRTASGRFIAGGAAAKRSSSAEPNAGSDVQAPAKREPSQRTSYSVHSSADSKSLAGLPPLDPVLEPLLAKAPQAESPLEPVARSSLPPRRAKPAREVDPRHHPLKLEMVAACPGYGFTGRDAGALSELLSLGEPEEILRRWKRALASTGFPLVRAIHELPSRWNSFGVNSGQPRLRGDAEPVEYVSGNAAFMAGVVR